MQRKPLGDIFIGKFFIYKITLVPGLKDNFPFSLVFGKEICFLSIHNYLCESDKYSQPKGI